MHRGCAGASRREFLGLLGVGAAAVLTGCSAPATVVPTPAAVPPQLPPVPAAAPGASKVLFGGPTDGGRIVLTVDDGTCADCVAGYADFAVRTAV